MVTEIQYTNIKRVLDDLLDHPLLRGLTLEQVVRYTLRFVALHGYPKLYKDKEEMVEIKDYRGLLPCDLISIIQVRDCKRGICLRAMTDNFTPNGDSYPKERDRMDELAFKTQGRIIFTSFKDGAVNVAYKAIPVDDMGFPLLVDNETYLNALEAYIKVKVFTVLYDTGKIQAGVLSNAQTEYAWASRQVMMEFTMPSVSEMESISRYLNTMIKPVTSFDQGFKHLGNREYLRRH